MHRVTRRLLTLLLGTALVAAPLTLVTAPAQAAPAPAPGGTVVAWGPNGSGQSTVPSALASKNVVAVAAGGRFSLALSDDGAVTAWGDNTYGQLDVPATLADTKVTAIAAGTYHALALTEEGTVVGWGYAGGSRLDIPASLDGERVVAITAETSVSFALTEDGDVVGWGSGAGLLAVPSSLTGKKVTAISVSTYHAMALTEDGTVTIWGSAPHGQAAIPSSLTGKTVTDVAASLYGSLVLTDDGAVTTWGNNPRGRPEVPASLSGRTVTKFAVAAHHVLAVADGALTAWGNDVAEDAGTATVPAVLAGKRVIAVAAHGPGSSHNLAIVTSPVLTTGLVADTATMEAGGSATFTPAVTDATPDAPSTWTVVGDDVATSIDPVTGEVTLSSTTAGTRTATLSIPTDLGTLTTTVTLVVTPVDVAALTLKVSAASPKTGDTVSVSAAGADRFGNPTGDETSHVTVSSSDRTDTVSGTDVRLGSAGPRTLTATHANGTIATVRVAVAAAPTTTVPPTTVPPKPVATLPAARLHVAVTGTPVVRGTRTTVSVGRLAPRERYTIRIAGRTVARGTADARGRVRRAVVVPRTRPAARQLVTVTGSRSNRLGRDSLAVVTGRLTATAKKAAARASTAQRVTVRGLVPGQKVRVTYRGKRISAVTARATSSGTYTVRFDVGQRWGTKKVTVSSGGRSTHVRFAVGPRHG